MDLVVFAVKYDFGQTQVENKEFSYDLFGEVLSFYLVVKHNMLVIRYRIADNDLPFPFLQVRPQNLLHHWLNEHFVAVRFRIEFSRDAFLHRT